MKLELNKIYKGLALDVIKTFPDKSINCVITSPPYWQLRDYGFSEQWGLEPTFEEYLEHLWSLMDEIWRVLKDDGTVWVNLGDTYYSNKSSNSNYNEGFNERSGNSPGKKKQEKSVKGLDFKTSNEIPVKSLCLIPHRFAIGCISRGWIMRNDIIWAKRNAMPEPVTDRFSKKHEYFFFMAKSQKYYFDLDGIRDKCKPMNRWGGQKLKAKGVSTWDKGTGQESYRDRDMQPNGGMKNPGTVSDFWDIPTKPSSKDHYAAYNDELIKKPILAGCPEGGIILDPFCGTGTTLMASYFHGRKVIGVEGSEDFHKDAESELKLVIQRKKDIDKYGYAKEEVSTLHPTLNFKSNNYENE